MLDQVNTKRDHQMIRYFFKQKNMSSHYNVTLTLTIALFSNSTQNQEFGIFFFFFFEIKVKLRHTNKQLIFLNHNV